MNELTEWDIEQLNRIINGNKNAGYLVETKTGFMGRTYNCESMVNGKVKVFLSDGRKMLCDPGTLKINGFID